MLKISLGDINTGIATISTFNSSKDDKIIAVVQLVEKIRIVDLKQMKIVLEEVACENNLYRRCGKDVHISISDHPWDFYPFFVSEFPITIEKKLLRNDAIYMWNLRLANNRYVFINYLVPWVYKNNRLVTEMYVRDSKYNSYFKTYLLNILIIYLLLFLSFIIYSCIVNFRKKIRKVFREIEESNTLIEQQDE